MRLSFVALGIGFLTAPAAFAGGGADICNRVSINSDRNQCVAAVSGKRIDSAAVDICSRISINSDIVNCARAVAGRYVAPAAATLCGRISINSDIVNCARAVAGHNLDAGAVDACGRVSVNSDIVNCARAIVDKEYTQDDLSMCNSQSVNSGIVQCMRNAGRHPPPPQPVYAPVYTPPSYAPPTYAQPTYDPYQVPPSNRRARVPQGSSTLTIDNLMETEAIVRLYWRPAGQRGGWSENILVGAITAGQKRTLTIQQGHIDLCAELADGSSTWWTDRQIGPEGANYWVEGTKYDTNKFAYRKPCRGRDRR